MNNPGIQQFEHKLKILLDILSKKKEALISILNITENQSTVLQTADSAESASFLKEMHKEKSVFIEQVLQADEIFQRIFDSLDAFETNAPKYKELIGSIQEGIKEVMDLDVKIRILENKNKEAKLLRKPVLQVHKASKQYILSQYEKNKKKEN